MKLLIPFDDELVGSFLSRAHRETGMSMPRLLTSLTGHELTTHSFVIAKHAGIARACSMTHERFVANHTTAAYSTSFMAPEQRSRLLRSILDENPDPGAAAALAHNVTRNKPRLRYCPVCRHEDLQTFGQSFWRRSHQLPAVTVCLRHGRPLHGTTIPLQIRLPAPPPHECVGTELQCCLPIEIQLSIAQWSEMALNGQLQADAPWTDFFRQRASATGYELQQGTNFCDRLAADLEQFYTRAFLEDYRCPVHDQNGPKWPARLLRASGRGIEPLKHVLLCVFLDSKPVPSPAPGIRPFKARGPKSDKSAVDAFAVERATAAAAHFLRRGQKANLTLLLRHAEIEPLWRHSYPRLPLLRAWVAAYKASEQYKRWGL